MPCGKEKKVESKNMLDMIQMDCMFPRKVDKKITDKTKKGKY